MQVPFERIGMDLIGPLERSARGHHFALVIVGYATRYPEAVALRNISAKSVADALFSLISRVGIPKEILTDQGTAFMSRTLRELYKLLGIKSIRTSVFHPQTDGLVECFKCFKCFKITCKGPVWQGPFDVTRHVGELYYEVVRSDRRGVCQIYHFNLLKKWNEAKSVMLATVISGEDDLGLEASIKKKSLALVPGGDHLSPSQLTDLAMLQAEFADVFSPLPGRTNLIQHHIDTEPGVVIRSRPYRLPEHKKKVVQAELGAMLEMGVIEESSSNWASPTAQCGSVWITARSKFNAYPMPRVDKLLDWLGTARFYSTLDLMKG